MEERTYEYKCRQAEEKHSTTFSSVGAVACSDIDHCSIEYLVVLHLGLVHPRSLHGELHVRWGVVSWIASPDGKSRF
jgi:hypothetical protein